MSNVRRQLNRRHVWGLFLCSYSLSCLNIIHRTYHLITCCQSLLAFRDIQLLDSKPIWRTCKRAFEQIVWNSSFQFYIQLNCNVAGQQICLCSRKSPSKHITEKHFRYEEVMSNVLHLAHIFQFTLEQTSLFGLLQSTIITFLFANKSRCLLPLTTSSLLVVCCL